MSGEALKAFKRGLTLETSTWYKGILTSGLATSEETGGAFDLVHSNMRAGTEPPPHVHSRESEFFYVLDGKLEVYVDSEVFEVGEGEFMFLPMGRPHAFLIRSAEIRMLVQILPGGFVSAVGKMAVPAEKLEIPSDMQTYATADLETTLKVFADHGIRFLSPEEIAEKMPAFPVPHAL